MSNLSVLQPNTFLRREAATDILRVNRATASAGLILSQSQAAALVSARDRALTGTGRVELGSGVVEKLILAFYDSPFFQPDQAVETFDGLLEIFYYLKNETFDTIGDKDLIAFLREHFDGECKGSLELLQGVPLDRLARRIHGAPQEEATFTSWEEEEDE
jgi:hypothetical protein